MKTPHIIQLIQELIDFQRMDEQDAIERLNGDAIRDIPAEFQIYEHLFLYFKYNNKKVIAWLNADNLHLGGVNPITLIARGRSHKVLAFVESSLAGY
jgi:hypothetical protein